MDSVTAALCQKQIRHCHAWIERFMQSEEGGSLQQFTSLQTLLPFAAALLQSEEVTATLAPTAAEDEGDEGASD